MMSASKESCIVSDVQTGRVTWSAADFIEVFLSRSLVVSISPELAKFGDEIISKQVLDWATDAERNVPYLRGGGRDAFGRRTSELVVSEGWRKLQDFGIESGWVQSNSPVSSKLILKKVLLNQDCCCRIRTKVF